MSSLWVYEKFSAGAKEMSLITLADISPEYGEAEIYYTALITHKYNEIKTFKFFDNSKEQEILLKELSEMDTLYESLKKDLNVEQGNQTVINAIIRYYQLKFNIMAQILEHLYQVQSLDKLNTKNDEEISI